MKKTFRGIRTAAFVLALMLSFSINMQLASATFESGDDTMLQKGTDAETETEDKLEKFKDEVLALVNLKREKIGVMTLEKMELLNSMADTRAEESSVSFTHTRPNGTRCFSIFKDNLLIYSAAGENLAFGYSEPSKIVQAWMVSASHRCNLLDPDFTYVGIGFHDNGRRVYCSLLFYTPLTVQ